MARDAVRRHLLGSVDSLADFARIRRLLSGGENDLAALRALAAEEPELEGQLCERVLPSIMRYAESLIADEADALPLHRMGQRVSVTIPRAAAAGWVAHMILGTLPQPPGDFSYLDFGPLLARSASQELAKLRCILTYFDRIADFPPQGSILIERIVTSPLTRDDWLRDDGSLTEFTIHPTGGIEDTINHRQVDFANQYIGGGVLSGGCVQEEILFATCPELLTAMIVSPRMLEFEAVLIRGAERYAHTSGYGYSLRYSHARGDSPQADGGGEPFGEIVAIDAMDYRGRDPREQYRDAAMLRELTKARTGFLSDGRALPVATGNWGCGVFGGNPVLKALLQWIAASREGRSVDYFSFGDSRIDVLEPLVEAQRKGGGTVGSLFAELLDVLAYGASPDTSWRRVVAAIREG